MKDLLKNLPEGILSEDTLAAIEKVFNERVDLHVEKALAQQDELYAEKLQTLIKAIDKDHTAKLNRVVEAIDQNNAKKLKFVVSKYEKEISSTANIFKESLIDNISDYLDVYMEKVIPATEIKEAVRNKQALTVLENLRKVLSVDSALINSSIREAVMDGKQQIEESSTRATKLQEENNKLRAKLDRVSADLLIESKTRDMSSKKKEYMKKLLSDKTSKFIEENFDYTSKLFDKKETERIGVLTEQAFETRVVKSDTPKNVVTESKKNSPADVYVAELSRFR
jgi:hypothetical protein